MPAVRGAFGDEPRRPWPAAAALPVAPLRRGRIQGRCLGQHFRSVGRDDLGIDVPRRPVDRETVYAQFAHLHAAAAERAGPWLLFSRSSVQSPDGRIAATFPVHPFNRPTAAPPAPFLFIR